MLYMSKKQTERTSQEISKGGEKIIQKIMGREEECE